MPNPKGRNRKGKPLGRRQDGSGGGEGQKGGLRQNQNPEPCDKGTRKGGGKGKERGK